MRNSTKSVRNKRPLPKKEGEGSEHARKRTGKTKIDKKTYRLEKYSNKYKINQWEEKRKKAVKREFYKELKKDRRNSAQTSLDLSDASKYKEETNGKSKGKSYAFHKAKKEYRHRIEEKQKRKEDTVRAKAEREEALRKYKEKKIRTYKALSKRTKKGQPVMKDRIEMLLEKIQQDLT